MLQRVRNWLRLFLQGRVYDLLSVGLRLRSPRLVAAALAIFTKRLGDTPKENVSYRVLCINRFVFLDNVKALNAQATQIEFLFSDYSVFKPIFRTFISDPDVIEDNYVEHSELHAAEHQTLVQFWRAVLVHWQKRSGFDAVLYGKWRYPKLIAFSSACVANDIPCIFLEGHGLQSPNKIRHYFEKNFLLTHFYGTNITKVLTANERFAEVLLQAPGVSLDKVTPVGLPRTDMLFRSSGNSRSHISLFLTVPRRVFDFLDDVCLDQAIEKVEWFYVTLFEMAQQFPDLLFVIKVKEHQRDYAADLLRRYSLTPGENLTITGEIEPATLIRDSRLVLSYKSATLFEALANGKPIAEPDLRDLLAPDDGYGEEHDQLTNYVTSREDLVRLIQNPEAYVSEPAVREQVLRKYLYRTDGKASERVNDILMAEIEKARERKLSSQVIPEGR